MNKPFYIVPALIFLCNIGLTQELYNDLPNRKWEKGIYFSFEQFISNSPAFDVPFYMKWRNPGKIKAWGGAEYKMVYTHQSTYDSLSHRSIWGVCDGENLFISNHLISNSDEYSLLKVQHYPYCSFSIYTAENWDEEGHRNADGSFTFGAIGVGVSSIPIKRIGVVDLRTGDVSRLNKKTMNIDFHSIN